MQTIAGMVIWLALLAFVGSALAGIIPFGHVINVSPDGANMHDVEVGDLNSDGKLDIVTRHQSGFGKRMGNQIHHNPLIAHPQFAALSADFVRMTPTRGNATASPSNICQNTLTSESLTSRATSLIMTVL